MSLFNTALKIIGKFLILHDEKDIGKIHSTAYVPFGIHHYIPGTILYSIALLREEIAKLEEKERQAVIGVEETKSEQNQK